MNMHKSVDVVRWTPMDRKPIQCLTHSGGAGYDTLCGTDINDPGTTNQPGSKTEYKTGRVTCLRCLEIIKAVLDAYT